MRVVIADDNLLVRRGIASLLQESGLDVAAEADCAEDLLRAVAEHEPDVAIVDIRMPRTRTSPARRRRSGAPLSAIKPASIAVFSNHAPPPTLKDLTGKIAPTPLLLIAAPGSGHGEELNRGCFEAAGEPKALWEIPESGHVGGLDARPEEYERRVVGFFNEALL